MSETVTQAPTPRLKTQYDETIKAQLTEQFGYENVMLVPGLTKIVVNMGVGDAARDSKLIDGAVRDLTAITGQKPTVTKARKSMGVCPFVLLYYTCQQTVCCCSPLPTPKPYLTESADKACAHCLCFKDGVFWIIVLADEPQCQGFRKSH